MEKKKLEALVIVGTRKQLLKELFQMMAEASNPRCRIFFISERDYFAEKDEKSGKRYVGTFTKI